MIQANELLIPELLVRILGNSASFLDCNNILWKVVNGEFIGKRSVWCKDNRAVWLNETTIENVKIFWCGENSDHEEIFKK